MKMVSEKFQQQKEKKQQQKNQEKLIRLETGFEYLKLKLPKIFRNIAFRRIIKKLKYNIKITSGLDVIEKYYIIKINKIKKNNFNKFLLYSKENKQKLKKEKEKKEKEERDIQQRLLKEKLIKEKQEKENKEKLLKENMKEEEKLKNSKDENIKENEESKNNNYINNKIESKEKEISSFKKKIEEDKATDIMFYNKNNMPNLKDKGQKISQKKNKLEDLKKKEENYINQVNFKSKRRFEEMKIIEDQLDKQKKKFNNIKEGIEVSETDSNISFNIDDNFLIKNGFERLSSIISKILIPLKRQLIKYIIRGPAKKRTTRKSVMLFSEKKLLEEAFEKASKKDIRESLKHPTSKGKSKILEDLEQLKEKEFQQSEIKEESSYLEDGNSEVEETFIQTDRIGDIDKPVDKSQLVEYDLFYKEQFFKNDVFKYDVNNIQDKEVQEINHEMNKLDAKRRLIEKKKERDVQASKGLDTKELEEKIKKLEKEYIKAKTKEKPKLELIMNNTEGLLYKGRLLGCYFNGIKEAVFPRFAMESEKEIGAKEVIDFKILRKEEQARRFFDYCCCLEERKTINKWLVYTRFYCRFFVDNWIFDNLSLLVIILNTILILISDPTDSNNIGNLSDQYFLYFYTIEAILKIISFKFFSAEDAYIRDYWNILDFLVVLVGWISFIIEKLMNGTKISGLAGLRAFRILRPLKTVKRFKGLKKLVTALLASIAHLGETTIVLIFFFLIFAIAGRQMWMGNFYRRCMNVNYGYLYSTHKDKQMCSFDSDCDELNSYGMRYICSKGYRNPDSGAINFDNTLTGFVTIFVMVTLEGWTNVFTYVSKTFKDKIYVNPIIIFFIFIYLFLLELSI